MSDEQDPMEPDAETAYTKLTSKIKRGTGTRDQDTTKLVTRHPDPSEACVRHAEALHEFERVVHDVRAIQPGGDDDG